MREVTTVATNFNLEQHCYLEEQLYKRWPSATSVRLSLATHMTFYANSLKFVTSRISTLWTSRSFSLFPFSLISIVSRQFKIVARNYWMIHAATFNQYAKIDHIVKFFYFQHNWREWSFTFLLMVMNNSLFYQITIVLEVVHKKKYFLDTPSYAKLKTY